MQSVLLSWQYVLLGTEQVFPDHDRQMPRKQPCGHPKSVKGVLLLGSNILWKEYKFWKTSSYTVRTGWPRFRTARDVWTYSVMFDKSTAHIDSSHLEKSFIAQNKRKRKM